MAIIIPSKDIYSLDTAPIVKNIIDNVEIEDNSVVDRVASETVGSVVAKSAYKVAADENLPATVGGSEYKWGAVWVGCINKYWVTFQNVELPILQQNKTVNSIDNRKTSVEIIGDYIKRKNAVREIRWDGSRWESPKDFSELGLGLLEDSKYDESIIPPETIEHSITIDDKTVSSKYDPTSGRNIYTFSYRKVDDKFIIDRLDVYCGLDKAFELTAKGTDLSIGWKQFSGTVEFYEPKQVAVTINGYVYTLDITKENKVYGDGNSPFNLTTSELMQTGTKTNDTPTSKVVSDEILEQYKIGKQTATLTCDVSRYYEEEGDIPQINSNGGKMLFEEFDEVIPFVHTADGDKPMAYYADGTPKVFEVTGVKQKYDGACWQILSLLEK